MSNASTILRTTRIVTDALSDDELNSLYLAASLDSDPRQVHGYKKAKTLFSEGNGTRVPKPILDALTTIWNEQFGGEEQ